MALSSALQLGVGLSFGLVRDHVSRHTGSGLLLSGLRVFVASLLVWWVVWVLVVVWAGLLFVV